MTKNESYDEVKSKTFKFGGVGDFIKGTLTGVTKTTTKDAYGKLSQIYSVLGEEGTYLDSQKNEKTGKYVVDSEPTIVEKGKDYNFFISEVKGVVIGAMKDVVIGQKFMIKFTDLKPTDKGNDAKIIKVFAGKTADGKPLMNKEWLSTKTETADDVYNELENLPE